MMKIYFVDSDETFSADMYYNIKEVNDCVFVSFKEKLHDDILFYKRNNEWHSDSDLQIFKPETYLNIKKAVQTHFKVEEIFYDLSLSPFVL